MKGRKIFVSGRMDLDSDRRNVAPNNYGYALNVLTNDTSAQNRGTIENRRGNTLVNFALPNGRNKCIGACRDIKRNAIVYFVWNSQNGHCILRYNISPHTIDRILYLQPPLNFREDKLITHCNIIGDLLYWTDGYFEKFTWEPPLEFPDIGFNGPRKINMLKAYNYTNAINVPQNQRYTQITERVLDRIKYAPSDKPIAEYGTDSESKFNFLVGNVFQFAYSYGYDDKEISVLGPISDVPIPQDQEFIDGTYNTDMPTLNNVINVSINTGPEIVERVLMYVRRLNSGDWYLFDTIEKYNSEGNAILPHNQTYDYSMSNGLGFYNNEVMISDDQAKLARTMDFVGQIVDSQELLSDNRLIDGGITENYDNINIDILLQNEFIDLDFAGASQNLTSNITNPNPPGPLFFPEIAMYATGGTYTTQGGSYQNSLGGILFEFVFPPSGTVGDVFTISFSVGTIANPGNPQNYTFIRTYQPGETIQDVVHALYLQMVNVRGQYDDCGYTMVGGTYSLRYMACYLTYENPINPDDEVWIFDQLTGTSVFNIIRNTPIISSFKEGFDHYFGIQYYDRAGRHGAVNKDDNSVQYVKFITENQGYQNISTTIRKANVINWSINHRPPEWAVGYQWFYARQTPKFQQYYYTEASIATGGIRIKISTKFDLIHATRPKSNIPWYTFTKGDRVRFIATGQFAVPNQWWYFPKFIDTEIVGYDTGTGELIIEDIGFSTNRIDIPTGWDYNVIEIYTPRKINDESLYYAIGPRLPIHLPHTENRAHIGEDGTIQTYGQGTVSQPLIRIDLDIQGPGLYQIKFVFAYPYSQQIPYTFLQPGNTITIQGLTDPQSAFLNGQHVIDFVQIISGSGEISVYVTTQHNFPGLTQPFYQNYPPSTDGYLFYSYLPTPASGIFNNGDVYVRGRYAVEPPLLAVEADSISDFYDSNAMSIGHPSVVVPDMRRQKYSVLRYSGQILEDTRINNLSRFNFLDKENVSNEFGDISAIRQLGLTLKVLQPRKVTSFGVGYQELSTAASGVDIPVVSTTKILSNLRPSVFGYGCINPESVHVNERYMYFYDFNSGKAIRDDANGPDAISDRDVKSWFRAMRGYLQNADSFRVYVTSNSKSEVLFTFIRYNTPEGSRDPVCSVDTIVYNEDINFWTTLISYHRTEEDGTITPPDGYARMGETLLAFMDGQVYVDSDNDIYGNFFGQNHDLEVEIIDNADFEKEKVFLAIALATNSNVDQTWTAPEITIPPTSRNPQGQLTRIRRFREKEENLYADTPRNILSRKSGTENYLLLNGDPMRGEACIYRLRNNDTGHVVLYSVIFRNIGSEISK